MIRIFMLLAICLQPSITEISLDFDPSKFDYCSKKCGNIQNEHTACHCALEGKREEILEDFMFFRKTMLTLHNKYRNNLAKGKEYENYNFPSAANMHVLNYDLELEYIARCHAKKFYDSSDACRWKHNMDWGTGQNFYGSHDRKKPEEFAQHYKEAVDEWYNEIVNITNTSIVDRFDTGSAVKNHPDATIGSFTQVIWATATHLGCSRVYIEHNPKSSSLHSVIICNYAGTEEGGAGNTKNAPIYIKGKPCSKCLAEEKCNTAYGGKWDALCGKSEEIPIHEPYDKQQIKKSEAYCLGGNLHPALAILFCLVIKIL